MRKKLTDRYEDRLSQALERGPRPMSVRALASELAERFPNIRGTSYGGVRVYAEGGVKNPRTELLRAMAQVLEVRSEWLAFGEGAMTEEAQRMAEGVADSVDEQLRGDESGPYRALMEHFPELQKLDLDIPGLFFMHCHRRWVACQQVGLGDDSGALFWLLCDQAWEDLWAPFDSWQEVLERRVPLDAQAVSHHFRSMIPALDVALAVTLPPNLSDTDLAGWEPLDDQEDDDA